MSDTLNALQAANRSASVLQGIANPPQINPLAAITVGNQAAQAEFQTRGLQAQQAIGQILQQATDENGNVDFQKAHRMAAAAGPVVQMGMMSMAKDASLLRGQQINNAGALHSFVGNLAVSGVQNPSDENWDNIRSQAVNAGMPANGIAEIDRIRALPSDQRPQAAFQHVVSNLDALQRLHIATGGAPVTFDKGNTVQGGTQNPITGALNEAGPPVAKSMTPGQGGMVDAVIQTDKGPVTIQVPYQQAFPGQVTPAAPAAPGGGGAPSVTPPPPHKGNTQRPSFPPPPPVIQTSPTPSSPTPAPIVPGEATPAPAATPAPTTPAPTASSPVIQTPAGPAIVKTAPVGTEQDINAYKAAQAAMPEQQKSLTAGLAALEALKLARTGPGTATSNAVKSFMIAQGISGADLVDQGPEQYQIARKNLLRFAQANGGKVGTDLGLSTQLESNANVDTLLNSVNDHIMKQDIATLRQHIAQTQTAPGAGGTGKTEFGEGMGAHVQNFTPKTDRMAFAWDLLTPAERQEHLDQISKQEGGKEKWERSMKIARDTGAWSLPRVARPPVVVRPPSPNPLIPPAGPGGG
jgi:hypothetical protein